MYALRLDVMVKIAVAFAMAEGDVCAVLAMAAPPAPVKFETKAKHAILMDADADLVFFEKDADALVPPASMSKLMTLAVVFRELKADRLKLEDQFKVSEHAWRTGGAPSGSAAMFAPLNSMVSCPGSHPGRDRAVRQRRLPSSSRKASAAARRPSPWR